MKPQIIKQKYLSEPFELGKEVDTNKVLFYGGGDFVVMQSITPFMKSFCVESFITKVGEKLARLRIIIERPETEEEVIKRVNDEVALFHQFLGKEIPENLKYFNVFTILSGVVLVPLLYEVINELNVLHPMEWSTDFEESWGNAVMVLQSIMV